MGFSLARLTLYGMISSLDEDLRAIIKSIPSEGTRADLYGEVLFYKLQERATKEGLAEEASLADYLDLGDTLALLSKYKGTLGSVAKGFFTKNYQALIDLVPIRNRVMHARPLQYIDLSKTEIVSNLVRAQAPKLFPTTIDFLRAVEADPNFPFALDVSDLQAQQVSMSHNLPIPDFDETGFLGRENDTNRLVAACKGPWPIITVVAEGGYGKTALALQAAYRLLDDESKPFEYIVWTSSKTTRLTLHEVEEIGNSISTSIGLFQSVSQTLSGSTNATADAVEEVLSYLNTFRILLILDNLETVLDSTVLNLFSRLNGRSKILVTSRVGTGEMNFRFPLDPLSREDSISLLRATARARRVTEILKISSDDLASYCKRMKFNAGFIKWFVSAVQAGRRPEEVLVDPKIFLDFCLSNVYDYVSNHARILANVMLSIPGRHSQSILSFISNIKGDDFRQALQQLCSANLAIMSGASTGSGFQTVYELGELPRLFILKNHAPAQSEVKDYQSRKRKIGEIYKEQFAKVGIDRYFFKNIHLRTADDAVVAKYLRDALAVAQLSYEKALSFVATAKGLDPAYYEVYRVEAIIHRAGGNFPAVVEAYETAVSCEPSSAPLRYWYAGFLMRDADDMEGASVQFRIALSIDPTSPQIVLEFARCLMFDGKYTEANRMLQPVLQDAELPSKSIRKAHHLGLQIRLRELSSMERKEDIEGKVEILLSIRKGIEQIRAEQLDEHIIETIRNAKIVVGRIFEEVGDKSLSPIMQECKRWFFELDAEALSPGLVAKKRPEFVESVGLSMAGTIAKYDFENHYGFIELDNGSRIFFHKSEFRSGAERIAVGVRAAFVVASDGSRKKATELVILASDGEEVRDSYVDVAPSSKRVGVIKTYLREKGFGFIYDSDGNEVFFHKNNLNEVEQVGRIAEGERVEYVIGRNTRGIVANQVRLLD